MKQGVSIFPQDKYPFSMFDRSSSNSRKFYSSITKGVKEQIVVGKVVNLYNKIETSKSRTSHFNLMSHTSKLII